MTEMAKLRFPKLPNVINRLTWKDSTRPMKHASYLVIQLLLQL